MGGRIVDAEVVAHLGHEPFRGLSVGGFDRDPEELAASDSLDLTEARLRDEVSVYCLPFWVRGAFCIGDDNFDEKKAAS